MKIIEATKVQDLVEIASAELLEDLRREGISKIKAHLSKIRVLSQEIDRDEKGLVKKRESLKKSEEIIEKLKGGDWTALSEAQEQKKEEPKVN